MDSGVVQTAMNAVPLDLLLWGVMGAMFLVFVVLSAILFWHWSVYSTGKYTTISALVVYLSVSAGFFILMGLSALWYTFA